MPLKIVFADRTIQELCECRSVAERTLGTQAARRLRARLADICAAESIKEVVAGSPKFQARGHVVFALYPPHKLVLEPAMTRIPTNGKGELNWEAIDIYRVLRVSR